MPSRQPDEYARMAPLYDPATAWALAPLRRRIAHLAQGRGPALDVCCGTGRQCLEFSRLGLAAFGLDLSPAMLERAAGLPGPLFLRGDACCLPFPDAAFGFTCVTLALHEKPPELRLPMLGEMARVTRPGGFLAVADYLSPPRMPGQVALAGMRLVERLAGKGHHACYAHFMASGGLEGLLRAAGLKPDTVEPSLAGLAAIALVRRT